MIGARQGEIERAKGKRTWRCTLCGYAAQQSKAGYFWPDAMKHNLEKHHGALCLVMERMN